MSAYIGGKWWSKWSKPDQDWSPVSAGPGPGAKNSFHFLSLRDQQQLALPCLLPPYHPSDQIIHKLWEMGGSFYIFLFSLFVPACIMHQDESRMGQRNPVPVIMVT